MAACSFCGNKAGMLRDVCDTCQQTQRELQAAAAEKSRAENAERFERETQEKLENWAGRTAEYLTSGGKAFVYKYVYLQVDSVVTNDNIGTWDMSALQSAGLAGWQVLSVIPRTIGIGLTNVSYGTSGGGETWGAGIGGNVAGVYVLLGKEIDSLEGAAGGEVIEMAHQLIADGYSI